MSENSNGHLISGFRRVKPVYENCPSPSDVYAWCVDADDKRIATSRVKMALTELDALADKWPAIDRLRYRIGDNHPQLSRQLLGLDFDTQRQRLRAAVARAYQATWRYSDIFCDWRDAYKNANKILNAAQSFLVNCERDLLTLAHVRERTGFLAEQSEDTPSPSEVLERITGDLITFINDTRFWAKGAADMADRFPPNAPRIFLYLRLAEIYTCFSGKIPPMHISGRTPKSELSDEQNFVNFLEPALNAIGYPSPTNGGADKVMRDIAKHIVGHGRWFKYVKHNKSEWIISYQRLPSISLHNGLNCFSETEL